MLDFLVIATRSGKRGIIEIYPKFIIKKSSDLMIRGGDFYAIWIEERGLWSTDEQDAVDLIDYELDRYAEENCKRFDDNYRVMHMWDAETGMIDTWHKYCQKQMKDQFHMLDEKLIFSNSKTGKKDYASKMLNYPLEQGEANSYDKLMSVLYSPTERHKIEWAIGSVVSGDSKRLQKFMVLYGAAGTGKSTVLNIIQQLFEGYYSVFDAKALGSSSNAFALEAFKTNPLVAIQHDGDLSRIEDDQRGEKEDILVPKSTVGIVENPFYAVMNEPNSTMQRLIRKLNLLDAIDEQNSSGKLNLIIQLPYVIKTESRRQQAELRRQDIENQLASSKYGVAYTDGTEHVVQLNRPVENNLMSQIEYLTSMLYSQLGLTQGILDGSADDKTMQNYLTRIVEPILSAIVDEIKRKFLTKTARSQKQSILFFRDPFKLVPVDKIAEMTDKFTRNEVMTSNEIRQKIGMKPSSDPKADELRNSNLSAPAESTPASTPKEDNNQNGEET